MYTFSSKLKTFSFVLMIVGILGIGYGFLTAPKDIQEVEKMLAAEEHHEGHHEAEGENDKAASMEAPLAKDNTMPADVKEKDLDSMHVDTVKMSPATTANHGTSKTLDSTSVTGAASAHQELSSETKKAEVHDEKADHQHHLEHVLQQLQNKPWAALYVACIFFLLITMGVLAFYGIQQVAQAGWSPVLFRVMEGITSYLPVASVIFFIFLILCGTHVNHLFVWLEPGVTTKGSANYDAMIAGKSGYLNFGFWIVRAAIFLAGWNLYRYLSRKRGLAQDESDDNSNYKAIFKMSAGFLVFFIVSESIMAWDWIMSLDPHWFSTLFGWYVFASFFVSGITTICMITLYMKSRGYLEYVNTSHIHDLAKFMFGISVFWTYLWFSQFMLIWYANIPEEVTYFVTRIEKFNLPFFGAVVMNFVFPILILVNTDFKRVTWILVIAGIVILAGHYIDFFNMVMPATVGDMWFIGIPEICSMLFFMGLFIFIVFTAMAKVPLLPKRNPYIEESKHFHY